MVPPFEIVRPAAAGIAVVAHVPHSSTIIPPEERAAILLDDVALAREVVRMTDWHTDRMFGWAVDRGASALIHRRSRLVVDPERFAGQSREPMEAVGQGVVYTRTSDGQPLRIPDAEARARTIATLFDPYHRALSALVTEQLDRFGTCTILDCHSFGTRPLPSEADQSPDRPDVCIGTDDTHTPDRLAEVMERVFAQAGFRVRRNTPFDGSIVPLDRYGVDLRVRSVMVEVRRGLYCDESTGQPTADFDTVSTVIERAVVAAGLLDGSWAT
jgi:N-formylglutamate amidohydrolase